MSNRLFVQLVLVLLLVACVAAPAPQTTARTPTPGPAATAVAGRPCGLLAALALATVPPATGGGVSTAVASTAVVVPAGTPAGPPTGTPTMVPSSTPTDTPLGSAPTSNPLSPTPWPTPVWPTLVPRPPLTNTQIRYEIIATLGDVAYCDPDEYPVPRGNEPDYAQQWLASNAPGTEEIGVIARALGLGDPGTWTPEQVLSAYREHKKLAAIRVESCDVGLAFEYNVQAPTAWQAELVTGYVDAGGAVNVVRRERHEFSCPICLAADTLIATPDGDVPVSALRPGMAVWTADANGQRIAGTILRTSRVPVPPGHQMAHLRLSDGRELFVSPGHPSAEGRALGSLRPGDALDGATVVGAGRVAYGGTATYDLLPGGPTGTYWANGVRIGSTLASHP